MGPVTRWLRGATPAAFTIYAVVASFSTYFCMYAFRKPFAVGAFAGSIQISGLPPLSHKTVFLIAQVFGYAGSKFLGIKVVSEMPPARRALAIVGCMSAAEAALVLFGITPAPWSAVWLVANGLSLGMIWGLVFSFLEGRKVSDLLGAGLCVSFIVASGFVKTVGKLTLDWGVPERWMPAVTGALFALPMLGSVWMLAQIPPPTAEDEALRTKRAPMDADARRSFFTAYAGGLVALVAAYVALSAFRDFRDNFARELWDALGYGAEPAIMTTAEVPVAVGALLAVALMMGIRDNRKALLAVHGVLFFGAALTGVSTLLFRMGAIGPAEWMIAVGLGLYVGYVPYNCVLFDRLIAAVGSVATAGFLIYVADAFGYLGSVGLLLYKSFGQPKLSWLEFFVGASYAMAGLGIVLFGVSALYFRGRTVALGARERG